MALWTPANYGDGADILVDIDPDAFTGLVDNDPITTGQDASGNGRHMTAAGAARPTWETNELAGHAVARFNGTANVADVADTGLTGQPFVLAAVTRFAAPIAADVSLFAGTGWAVWYDFVSPDAGLVLDLGSALTVASWANAQPVTTPLILAGGFDGTNTRYRATSEQQFVPAAIGTTGYPDAFKVGADAAGTGQFAAMDLARLIIANYVTDGVLDTLLGYLAWHYGLEATLPPDSPYLLAAPEVKTNEPSGRALSVITASELAALGAPADSDIGQAYAVATATGSSDFVAIARENAAGVKEWYREGDEFQLPIDYFEVLTDIAADTFRFASSFVINLTDFKEARFACRVMTAGNTARLKIQYTDDADTTYYDMGSNFIEIGATGVKNSDWEEIPSGAQGPVGVTVAVYNGDGAEDATLFAVVVHFRR